MKFTLIIILLTGCCSIYAKEARLDTITIDCQLTILEQLDIYDLLAVAEVNQHFSILTGDVFRRKFSGKSFTICPRYGKNLKNSVEISKTNVVIKNFKTTSSILRTFGRQIKSLIIEYTFIEFDERKELHRLIDEHCSSSVKSIQLSYCDENVLCNFHHSLPNITKLSITGELSGSNGELMLNEIFPNINSLYLEEIQIRPTDPKVLDHAFAKLEHISISSYRTPFLELSIFHGLIKKNPQIHSFTMIECPSFHYLNLISEYLSNLDALHITWNKVRNDFTGDPIHFSKVKKLTMKEMYFDYSEIVTFDQLDELVIDCVSWECVDYALKYRELKKLSIQQDDLTDEEVTKLIGNFKNLEEFLIKTELDIELKTILSFLDGFEKLSKFSLENDDLGILKQLEENLTNRWRIASNQRPILVERSLNY